MNYDEKRNSGPRRKATGYRGDPATGGVQRKDTGGTRPYREDPALQGRPGPAVQGRPGLPSLLM